ncbi:hypothetical protein MHBO_001806 [Bonamia ostreae]|uniref:Transcription factor CBF/NF-Y/archaeal histone domain-containing protein n=1 Tax=Bonamia ostreae TaxID=126728 RepID=A0ABV2AK84_9EUKA
MENKEKKKKAIRKKKKSGYTLFIEECSNKDEKMTLKKRAEKWQALDEEEKNDWNRKAKILQKSLEDDKNSLDDLKIKQNKIFVKETIFPLNRVKKIILSDQDVKRVNKEAILLVSKSTEKFIEYLSEKLSLLVEQKQLKTITKKDFDTLIHNDENLEFLKMVWKPS